MADTDADAKWRAALTEREREDVELLEFEIRRFSKDSRRAKDELQVIRTRAGQRAYRMAQDAAS